MLLQKLVFEYLWNTDDVDQKDYSGFKYVSIWLIRAISVPWKIYVFGIK